jgi:hypothetical protein
MIIHLHFSTKETRLLVRSSSDFRPNRWFQSALTRTQLTKPIAPCFAILRAPPPVQLQVPHRAASPTRLRLLSTARKILPANSWRGLDKTSNTTGATFPATRRIWSTALLFATPIAVHPSKKLTATTVLPHRSCRRKGRRRCRLRARVRRQ